MTLAGRVALVTGASMGLGAAIAERFVSAGAKVVVCARGVHALEEQRSRLLRDYPGSHVAWHRADLASKNDVDVLFAEAVRTFGKLDILVNNAGIYGPLGSTDEIDWVEWVEAISINLIG